MRMSGHVIGAPTTTANRRSVIFSADGSEARLTLDCTSAAAAAALGLGRLETCRSGDRRRRCAYRSEEVASIELTSDGRFHSGLRWARIISSGHTSASARRPRATARDVRYHPAHASDRSCRAPDSVGPCRVPWCCQARPPTPRAPPRAVRRTWEWELSESPTDGLGARRPALERRWDDLSLAAFERRQAYRQGVLRSLAGHPARRRCRPPTARTTTSSSISTR